MVHGVVIESYLTDSGTFKAAAFVQHIRDHSQRIRYCGANAHHKNGVAERAVQSVSNIARALLLHASAHWKNGIDSSLWPMTISYATYQYNHLPNAQGLCPADLFTGSTVPRHRLRDIHVWGCPVYVLDPDLQAEKNYLVGNRDLVAEFSWDSVHFIQVKFLWCSICRLGALLHSTMSCLTTISPLFLRSKGRLIHPNIGRTCVSKTRLIFRPISTPMKGGLLCFSTTTGLLPTNASSKHVH